MNLNAGRLRRDLVDHRIARLGERLSAAWKMAELSHPERPLQRGFARVTDRDGKTLMSAAAATAARELRLRFGDGEIDASLGPAGPPPLAVERRPRRSYVAPQPGLFDAPEE
jgi:exodeoxyribonuclease VII large subunit